MQRERLLRRPLRHPDAQLARRRVHEGREHRVCDHVRERRLRRENGLVILDVSDFQQRKANPAYRLISALTWDDGSVGAQNALPISIKGKPYILFSDEAGGGLPPAAQGKSGNGLPRLIDISDPAKPKTAAKIFLDVHDPANCTTAVTAPVTGPTTSGFFAFSCHYCNVDDVDDAKIAACNCFASGLRFFDITDVNNVREIAYLKPPAKGTQALPGSQYANSVPAGFDQELRLGDVQAQLPEGPGSDLGRRLDHRPGQRVHGGEAGAERDG